MSKNISLDEIKEFWPDKAPDINIVQKYIKKYENEKIVIKYGGNVLIDRNIFNNFIEDIYSPFYYFFSLQILKL